MRELKNDLEYAVASSLKRLLIDQVVACWLRLSYFENQLVGQLQQRTLETDRLKFWEGRASAAQRQYLWATKTLAQVRKLGRQTPSLTQIYIDAWQMATRDGPEVGGSVLGRGLTDDD